MDITTEVGVLFGNHPRRKNRALLLDVAIVHPCASSNLENEARHAGKHLADVAEREKNKYRGSFPATYSLLPLAISTCDEAGSEELAIRRVEHRSEIHSNESQHLAEETDVARIRRRFSFALLQTGSGACGYPIAPFTKLGVCRCASCRGVTRLEGREEASGDGNNRVGGGNADGDGDGDRAGTEQERERGWKREDERKMGTGTRAWTGVGTKRGQLSGDGKGGTGTGTGAETGKGTITDRERREEGGGIWYPPHQERSRVEDHALPIRTRHHPCRQEVAPAGSQQSFWRKTRCLPDDVVPWGKHGTRDGKEETVTGTGTGVEKN